MLEKPVKVIFYLLLLFNILLLAAFFARAPVSGLLERELKERKPELLDFLYQQTGLHWELDELKFSWRGLNPSLRAKRVRACLADVDQPGADSELKRCSLDITEPYLYLNGIQSAYDRAPRFFAVHAKKISITLEQSGLDFGLAGFVSSGPQQGAIEELRKLLSAFRSIDVGDIAVALVGSDLDWEARSTWQEHSFRFSINNNQGLLLFAPLDAGKDFISAQLVLSDDYTTSNGAQSSEASDGRSSLWRGYLHSNLEKSLGSRSDQSFTAPYQSMRMQIDTDQLGLRFKAVVGSSDKTILGDERTDKLTTNEVSPQVALVPLILEGHANVDTIFHQSALDRLPHQNKRTLVQASWTPLLSGVEGRRSLFGGGSFNLTEDRRNLTLSFEQGHFDLEHAVNQFQLVFKPVGGMRKIFDELNPRGKIDYFRLELPLAAPDDFLASASLRGVSVDSFAGRAPKAENVHGWLSFSRRSGAVLMTSSVQTTNVSFPQVYRQSLAVIPHNVSLKWYVAEDRYFLSGDHILVDYFPELNAWPKRRGAKKTSKVSIENLTPVSVAGRFYLDGRRRADLPSSRMSLEIGASDGQVERVTGLIPYGVNPEIHKWVAQSKAVGDFSNASFMYHGSVSQQESAHRSFSFAAGMTNADLNFQQEWPRVKNAEAGLLVNGQGFYAPIIKAELANLSDLSGEVSLTRNSTGSRLTTSIEYRHSSAALYSFLLNSPVRGQIPEQIRDWALEGELDGEVDIELLFAGRGQADPSVSVSTKARARALNLAIPQLDLTINRIKGDIAFSTLTGFSAKRIEAQIWGSPVVVDLSSPQTSNMLSASNTDSWNGIEVTANGNLRAKPIIDWIFDQESVLHKAVDWVDGAANFELNYQVREKDTALSIKSDLVGVELKLPQPFTKQSAQPRQLLVTRMGAIEDPDPAILIGLGSQLNSRLQMKSGALDKLEVTLYPRQQAGRQDNLTSPSMPDANIVLGGYLPKFDGDEWQDFVERHNLFATQTDNNHVEQPTFRIDKLAVGDFRFLGRRLGASGLSVSHDNVETQISISSELIEGRFRLPKLVRERSWGCDFEQDDARDKSETYEPSDFESWFPQLPENLLDQQRVLADINYLNLDELLSDDALAVNSEVLAESREAPHWLSPECLFPLEATIANLEFATQEWRDWGFHLSVGEDVALLHNIKGSFEGLNVRSGIDDGLRWAYRPDGVFTSEFNGSFASLEIERSLKNYLNVDSSPLLAKNANLQASLNWEGGPLDIALNKIEGSMDFDLRDGQFVEVSGAANGFLRVMSLINLQRYISRLSLDVSSVYKDGVSYDELSGSVSFDGGKAIFVETPISMKAASNDFVLSGEADFVSSSLDAELVATLPISKNLPWLVAIAGGLPVAAGTFIATQALDSQINRFSSVVYTVSGSLDDPQLNLKTMFSDELSDKKDESGVEAAVAVEAESDVGSESDAGSESDVDSESRAKSELDWEEETQEKEPTVNLRDQGRRRR